ncbi:diaminopropionate ammonia-lyase [Anaerosporomusa subterranea]|uniref:Diaminopropionate ammonia-lyase n=1 Tax=Anaerosporomusa subterranea TaxID=1794912 RepID=A0A154BXU9_ANASB|nr:diaminopropionate ammonia-lyase [Anaerosporomusa subterranea]KYZ78298.1 diaminopropionate ammonia-lyase [Anaerosporomusa subterranea]
MSNNNDILWRYNEQVNKPLAEKVTTAFLSEQTINEVVAFHQSFSQYVVTPLQSLDRLAKEFNVGKIWVKDESHRFGLNAFKVLGGSFAIGKYLSEKLGLPMNQLTFEMLKSSAVKAEIGEVTFVTATDGNHGRGVAWAANQLGQKAVVYMPKGSAITRLANIRAEGAVAAITDLNYDDTVRLANRHAQENGWVVVQDTAWPGYEKIPTWIMQGYATIIREALEQIVEAGDEKPTHIFLQVGVGSFAGSILGYLADKFGEERPATVIVEPDKAACLYKSIVADDGEPHAVTGDLNTIMAGLACGEPNSISWGILRDYAEWYAVCPDYVAARGMRLLANPQGSDPRVISGESGAVGLGLVSLLAERDDLKPITEKLKLNQTARILIISTEGDTDPITYKDIVWNGAYPYVK